MGCFNTSCGVSRVSIRGSTHAVIIPLLKLKESGQDSIRGGAMIISNDGPRHTYYPFMLPIMGVYTDYGTLEDIEENEHTRAIESYYGMSIQKIADYICRPWDDGKPNDKFPDSPYGMWVHRKVYDHMVNHPVNEYGDDDSAYYSAYLNEFNLQRMGFVRTGEDTNRKRYTIRYEHPEIPTLVGWSDETWTHFEIGGKEEKYGCYNPKNLEEMLIRNNLPVPTSIGELKNIHNYDLKYDEAASKYVVLTDEEKQFQKEYDVATFSDNRDEILTRVIDKYGKEKTTLFMLKLMSKTVERCSILSFGDTYGFRKNYFDDFYSTVVKNQQFKKLFVQFRNFEHHLYMVNADYRPIWCGLQCGNYRASKMMGEVIIKIADEVLEEERKYIEEEEKE